MSRVLCLKVLVCFSISIQLLVTYLIVRMNSVNIFDLIRSATDDDERRLFGTDRGGFQDRYNVEPTTGQIDKFDLHKSHMFVATGTHWKLLSETRKVLQPILTSN